MLWYNNFDDILNTYPIYLCRENTAGNHVHRWCRQGGGGVPPTANVMGGAGVREFGVTFVSAKQHINQWTTTSKWSPQTSKWKSTWSCIKCVKFEYCFLCKYCIEILLKVFTLHANANLVKRWFSVYLGCIF